MMDQLLARFRTYVSRNLAKKSYEAMPLAKLRDELANVGSDQLKAKSKIDRVLIDNFIIWFCLPRVKQYYQFPLEQSRVSGPG